MLSGRGLSRSSRAIGAAQRRLEVTPARSFSSSSRHHAVSRTKSLLSTSSATFASRSLCRPQVVARSAIISNGAAVRFNSSSTPSTTPAEASQPTEWSSTSLNDLDFTQITNVKEHIGYLKELGLDYGWGPTSMMQWLLEHIHVYSGTVLESLNIASGMPWWGSITITAIVVRAALFKAYINASDNSAKMLAAKPITDPIQAKTKEAQKNRDWLAAQMASQELRIVYARAGINIWRGFVPLLQVPIGFGSFWIIRGMASLPVPGMVDGGILWFQNLAVPDPTFLLPAITSGILYALLKRGGELGSNGSVGAGAQKAIQYGLPIFTFAFSFWLPAGLQLSFLVSGIFSAIQGALFRNPGFRKWAGMYPLPEPNTPKAKPTTNEIRMAARGTNSSGNPVYQAPSSPSEVSEKSGIGKVIKEIKEAAASGKKSAQGYIASKQKTDDRRPQQDVAAAAKLEKRRREEAARLRAERIERHRWEKEQKGTQGRNR